MKDRAVNNALVCLSIERAVISVAHEELGAKVQFLIGRPWNLRGVGWGLRSIAFFRSAKTTATTDLNKSQGHSAILILKSATIQPLFRSLSKCRFPSPGTFSGG